MMYTIKNLAEKTLNKKILTDFLDFANNELKVDKPYSVYFVDDKVNAADPLGKTAMYNPSSNSVYVYATNRHPKDILRSIAHELMHHKQNCDGRLDKTYGEGSTSEKQLELEAQKAGYLVRMFEDGKKDSLDEQEKYKIVGPPMTSDIAAQEKARVAQEKARIVGVYSDQLRALDKKIKKLEGEFPKNKEMSIPELLDLKQQRKQLIKKIKEFEKKEFDQAALEAGYPNDMPKWAKGLYDAARNTYKAARSGARVGPEGGFLIGAFLDKCKSTEEKIGPYCYPKGMDLSIIDKETGLPTVYKNYTLENLKTIYETTKNNKSSVFNNASRKGPYQKLVEIYPKLIETIKNVANAPAPVKDYAKKREAFAKKLKDSASSLEEQEGDFVGPPAPATTLVGPPAPAASEKPKEDFYIYKQSVIDDARRIYKLTEKGPTKASGDDSIAAKLREGSPFGYYYYGEDESDPFRYKVPLSKKIINDVIKRLGGQKRVDDIISIYSLNLSSEAAIGKGFKNKLKDVHAALDVLGFFGDVAGIGVAADAANGLLYFIEWIAKDEERDWSDEEFINSVISFAAIFPFGEALKPVRGPIAKAMYEVSQFFKGNIYALSSATLKYAEMFLFFVKKVFDRIVANISKLKRLGQAKTVEKTLKSLGVSEEVLKRTGKQLDNMAKGLLDLADTQFLASKILAKGKIGPKQIREIIFTDKIGKPLVKSLIEKVVSSNLKMRGFAKEQIREVVDKILKDEKLMQTLEIQISSRLSSINFDKIIKDELNLEKVAKQLYNKYFKGKTFLQSMKQITNASSEMNNHITKEVRKLIKKVFDDPEQFKALGVEKYIERAQKKHGVLPRKWTGVKLNQKAIIGLEKTFEAYFRSTYQSIRATLSKNIFGTTAMFGLGKLFKTTVKSYFDKVFSPAWKIFIDPAIDMKTKKLMLHAIKSLFISIPYAMLFAVGKIQILFVFYIRYYRPLCGATPKQYLDAVIEPTMRMWQDFFDGIFKALFEETKNMFEKKNITPEHFGRILGKMQLSLEKLVKKLKAVSLSDIYYDKDGNILSTKKRIKCAKFNSEMRRVNKIKDDKIKKIMGDYYNIIQTRAGMKVRQIKTKFPAPIVPKEDFSLKGVIDEIEEKFSDAAVELADTVTQTDAYKEGLKTAKKLRERATELKKQADKFVEKNLPKEATQARQDAATAESIAKDLEEQSGGAGAFNETVSLADYREKLLEGRLEKITVRLIK